MGLKTSRMIHRKQKPKNSSGQMSTIDPSKGTDGSQVSCTEYIDHNFDIVLKKVVDSAVDITRAKSCGFLYVKEQISVDRDKDRVHSPAGIQSGQTAELEANKKLQLAEMAAAAADVWSEMDDALCDNYEDENDIEIERCRTDVLDTPGVIIDQKLCCTMPASVINVPVINWNVDKLTKHKDERRDLAVEELPDREVQWASSGKDMTLQQPEKKQEVDTKHTCTQSDTEVKDLADDHECVILLSDNEMTDSVHSIRVKMTPELTSGNTEFATAVQPCQPQQSLDVGSAAVEWMEEQSDKLHSLPVQQLSNCDAEFAPVEDSTEDNQNEDWPVVCTQQASSGRKEKSMSLKKKPRKRSKIVVDESEASLLKSGNDTDKPASEDSACLRQLTPECHFSWQHTAMADCCKKPGFTLSEAVELPEVTDNKKRHHRPQNSTKFDR